MVRARAAATRCEEEQPTEEQDKHRSAPATNLRLCSIDRTQHRLPRAPEAVAVVTRMTARGRPKCATRRWTTPAIGELQSTCESSLRAACFSVEAVDITSLSARNVREECVLAAGFDTQAQLEACGAGTVRQCDESATMRCGRILKWKGCDTNGYGSPGLSRPRLRFPNVPSRWGPP